MAGKLFNSQRVKLEHFDSVLESLQTHFPEMDFDVQDLKNGFCASTGKKPDSGDLDIALCRNKYNTFRFKELVLKSNLPYKLQFTKSRHGKLYNFNLLLPYSHGNAHVELFFTWSVDFLKKSLHSTYGLENWHTSAYVLALTAASVATGFRDEQVKVRAVLNQQVGWRWQGSVLTDTNHWRRCELEKLETLYPQTPRKERFKHDHCEEYDYFTYNVFGTYDFEKVNSFERLSKYLNDNFDHEVYNFYKEVFLELAEKSKHNGTLDTRKLSEYLESLN